MTPIEHLQQRAKDLHLYGLLAHWHELADSGWVEQLLISEETERAKRSLERRLGSAHIGRFKPIADFDWNWPEQCDRTAISELLSLEFLNTAANVILVGASGLGNSHPRPKYRPSGGSPRADPASFTTAGQLLGDLAALDSDSALRRRLRMMRRPPYWSSMKSATCPTEPPCRPAVRADQPSART